jgi:hypothetical protein
MDKSTIEKRILEKAEERFSNLKNDVFKKVRENELLGSLKIFIDKDKKEYVRICGTGGYCPGTDLFNTDKLLEEKTNFKEVKEEIIKEYVKEETDILLEKLDALRYFFSNNQ